MTNPSADASSPNDIPALEAELAEIDRQIASCRAEIKNLIDQENLAAGVIHAAAIHERKQAHMVLRYQKELLAAKIGRLRSGFS